jgi:SAM-dependent methyltransferase
LARQGYRAIGVDLSGEAVRQARERVEEEGLDAQFYVMNAESLDFDDASFDFVCGRAILHHLNIEVAYAEIARVLKPDGRALFVEPLCHNPLINLYRRMTPALRTPDERPLRLEDIRKARQSFGRVSATFWDLFTIAAVPLRQAPGFERVLRTLAAFDEFALRRTRLRKFAWKVVIELSEPRPA